VTPADVVAEALASFDVALDELTSLRDRLDPRAFEAALNIVRDAVARGGRVHVTGIGKAAHVAHYAAALFASTGTPATFLHATEVVHGSAGQVVENDVVIAVSNSGETHEIRAAIAAVRKMGARIVVVTGKVDSSLARQADAVLDAGVSQEGGPLGLAPRASVAAEILVVAAFSASLERELQPPPPRRRPGRANAGLLVLVLLGNGGRSPPARLRSASPHCALRLREGVSRSL